MWHHCVGEKKYVPSCEKESVGSVLVCPRYRTAGMKCCRPCNGQELVMDKVCRGYSNLSSIACLTHGLHVGLQVGMGEILLETLRHSDV